MKLREKYNNVIICKSDVIVAFDFLFFLWVCSRPGYKKSKDNPLGQMIERVFLLWVQRESWGSREKRAHLKK